MKKFRGFLVLLLAICMCAGIGFTSDMVSAAQTKITLSTSTVAPGNVVRWFQTDNVSGYSLTNGGIQTMCFTFGELGNHVETGFMQYATKTDYVWVSGIFSFGGFSKDKVLQGPTAYYQPYLKNKNETVYVTVKSGSYVMIQ